MDDTSIQKAASNLKKRESKRPSVILQEKLLSKIAKLNLDESEMTESVAKL